jgi:hypothetical protein
MQQPLHACMGVGQVMLMPGGILHACAVFTGMSLLLVPPGCGERPALTPACNVAAWLDARLLGPQHLYPFPSCRAAQPPCPYLDPEAHPCASCRRSNALLAGAALACVHASLWQAS